MTALSAGAPSTRKQNWNQVNWSLVQILVNRLQMRIAEAVRQGRWHKVKALQYLLSRSFYARMLAVKRIISNKGKKTPGVDGVIWKTHRQFWCAVLLLKVRGYKAQPLRRCWIPKSNGQLRPLGIPTMHDRAMQALFALTLKPVAETLGDKHSYGFREKRSLHDAVQQCFIALARRVAAPWVRKLNSKLRGWAFSNRQVVAKRIFKTLDNELYYWLSRWLRRRHRNKIKAWIKHRYSFRIEGRINFGTFVLDKQGKRQWLGLFRMADVPIRRHVKIRGAANPYDPAYWEYFKDRAVKQCRRRHYDRLFLASKTLERTLMRG